MAGYQVVADGSRKNEVCLIQNLESANISVEAQFVVALGQRRDFSALSQW